MTYLPDGKEDILEELALLLLKRSTIKAFLQQESASIDGAILLDATVRDIEAVISSNELKVTTCDTLNDEVEVMSAIYGSDVCYESPCNSAGTLTCVIIYLLLYINSYN